MNETEVAEALYQVNECLKVIGERLQVIEIVVNHLSERVAKLEEK